MPRTALVSIAIVLATKSVPEEFLILKVDVNNFSSVPGLVPTKEVNPHILLVDNTREDPVAELPPLNESPDGASIYA